MVRGSWLKIHDEMDIPQRLQDFIESEGKSCSMDIGGITSEYVYRMWGGRVPLDDIKEALRFQDSRSMFQEREFPIMAH